LFTIFDYIKSYRDISFEEVPWNMSDNLICSILAYLPTQGFKKATNLFEIYEEVKKVENPERLGIVEPKSIEILKFMIDSIRYSELEFSNFIKLKNKETQFGAVTIRINKRTIISFQGTDYSTIGWLENFRMVYEYPTYTQKLAVDYLNNVLQTEKNDNVYVLGHSKGGNLAMVSAMECPESIYNKIKQVYNFDGPGFREEEYVSKRYQNISKKLVNVVPSGSVIGMIMNNKDYHVIKTNCIGFKGHFPINWRIENTSLIGDDLSYISKQIHKSTTIGFKAIDNLLIREAIESLFDALSEDKTADIKLSLEKIIKTYNKLKLENPKIFQNLDDIFNSIFEAVKE